MKKLTVFFTLAAVIFVLHTLTHPSGATAQSTQKEDVQIIKNGDTLYLGQKIISEPSYQKTSRYKKSPSISFPQLKVPTFMQTPSLSRLVHVLIYSGLAIAGSVVLFSAAHGTLLWIHADGDTTLQEKAKTKLLAVTVGTCVIILGFGVQKYALSFLAQHTPVYWLQPETKLSQLEQLE